MHGASYPGTQQFNPVAAWNWNGGSHGAVGALQHHSGCSAAQHPRFLTSVDTFGITELLQPLMQFAVQKALTLHNAGPLLQSATRWHLGEIRKQVLRYSLLPRGAALEVGNAV